MVPFGSLWNIGPRKQLLHRTLFWAAFFSCSQVCPYCLTSSSHDLRPVLGRPTRRLLCGFHSSEWRVMSPGGFRRVYPIHRNFLRAICLVIGSWFVFSHRILLLIVSGHLMFNMWRRHLLAKVCSLLEVVLVTLHVSDP